MPWTEKLPNGQYRGCWRDAAGAKRSRAGFLQAALAMRYAGEQEGKTRRGEQGYVGRGMTWGAWRDEWLERRRVEPSTAAPELLRLRKWVSPRWERMPLNRITKHDVQDWVNALADEGLSPASVAKVYRLFSASLRSAVERGRLAATPCTGITLPTVAPGGERYLTRGEVDAILAELDNPYRAAVALLVGTGLRFGELAGLHWSRIDMNRMLVDVVETWDPVARRIKAYPKGRRRRGVPLPTWAAEALVTAQRDGMGQTCELPHAGAAACRSPLVLVGPKGAPLDAHNMRDRQWLPALRAAGVDHARLHDCRHTAASWWIQNGVPLEVVSKLLGHTSLNVTQRYAHLGSAGIEQARAAMER